MALDFKDGKWVTFYFAGKKILKEKLVLNFNPENAPYIGAKLILTCSKVLFFSATSSVLAATELVSVSTSSCSLAIAFWCSSFRLLTWSVDFCDIAWKTKQKWGQRTKTTRRLPQQHSKRWWLVFGNSFGEGWQRYSLTNAFGVCNSNVFRILIRFYHVKFLRSRLLLLNEREDKANNSLFKLFHVLSLRRRKPTEQNRGETGRGFRSSQTRFNLGQTAAYNCNSTEANSRQMQK